MIRIVGSAALALLIAAPSFAQSPAPTASAAQARGAGRAAQAGGVPFEREIQRFVDADRANPPNACQTLLVGSSSIARWTSYATDLSGLDPINRGFGGSQIENVNFHFDKVVAPYKPRRIVFYAGDNDINARKTPERVFADFEQFMKLKDGSLGTTPVYVISLKPSKSRMAQFAQQTEVNFKLKALAEKRDDLVYIDVVGPMMDGDKPKDIFVADNLHMTPEGYAIWTKVVKPVLQATPPTKAPGCSN